MPDAAVYHLHRLRRTVDPATFAHTVRIVRNRYLSFFKVMTLPEFLLAVPLITLGGPCNVTEFGLNRWQKLLYALCLVPVTGAALAVTLMQLRRFRAKRREVLATRRGFSALRAMWQRRPGTPVSAQASRGKGNADG